MDLFKHLAFGLAATTSAAASAEPSFSPPFAAYLESPADRDAVRTKIEAQIEAAPGQCRQVTFAPTFKVAVKRPVQIHMAEGEGESLSGMWVEMVEAAACGMRHAAALRRAGCGRRHGREARRAAAGRDTRADPLMQQDATAHALVSAAFAGPPECKAAYVADTALLSEPLGEAPWREEWTVDACGATVVAPLTFIPGRTATEFSLLQREVRLGR